jgi:hypothetical protein
MKTTTLWLRRRGWKAERGVGGSLDPTNAAASAPSSEAGKRAVDEQGRRGVDEGDEAEG